MPVRGIVKAKISLEDQDGSPTDADYLTNSLKERDTFLHFHRSL
jgi:hypothetical protein